MEIIDELELYTTSMPEQIRGKYLRDIGRLRREFKGVERIAEVVKEMRFRQNELEFGDIEYSSAVICKYIKDWADRWEGKA